MADYRELNDAVNPMVGLKVPPEERIEQQTWRDNLRDNPLWQMIMELTGVAPSHRLVEQINQLRSPAMRPQTAFGMADHMAGMATSGLETALAGADLAGVAGMTNRAGQTAGDFLTQILKNQKGGGELPSWGPIRASADPLGSYVDETLHVVGSTGDVDPSIADEIAFQMGAVKTDLQQGHRTPHAAYFKTREQAEQYRQRMGGAADFISGETTSLPDTPGTMMGRPLGRNQEPSGIAEELAAYQADELKPFDASKVKTETRDYFGQGLGPESRSIISWYDNNRGKSAIHYNSKTGFSIDFCTSCPKRLDPMTGPCPYCYVEHGREADKLFNMKGANKGLFENPYGNEIMSWPDELIGELNKDGGIRMFSFGDYRPDLDYDNVARLLADANKRGLVVKAITKQPELIKHWADHPNMRINISIDNVPRWISENAPTKEQAVALAGDRPNVAVRAVALNRAEAEKFAMDPDVDVVTLYHGLTNFTTNKNDLIKSGALYDEMYNYYKQNGLAAVRKAYPDYNIRYLGKKRLTKKELEAGKTFRFEIKRPLELAEGRLNHKGQKLYRHDKLMKIVKDQNPQLVERIGEEQTRAYLDTWENMPSDSKFALDWHDEMPGRFCCEGKKCAKDRTKCGFGLGAMVLPGVLLPAMDEE